MQTVIEHPTFQRQAASIWSEDERHEFIDWIAANPLAGDVIPGAEGARKVRWSVQGRGKRGGARVIYFNYTEEGVLELFAVYVKTEREDMPASDINHKRRASS
ncbi:DNA-binding protein [Pantoea sp. 18069]|uniref:DNA-binding protein n=1 Tax=Pantoea sp. 18069 TaxID=2681415 RepID=UPI0013586764|nr:DNA-binding protein [Pantoea sp. 18069]